jgi:hypothetical protein
MECVQTLVTAWTSRTSQSSHSTQALPGLRSFLIQLDAAGWAASGPLSNMSPDTGPGLTLPSITHLTSRRRRPHIDTGKFSSLCALCPYISSIIALLWLQDDFIITVPHDTLETETVPAAAKAVPSFRAYAQLMRKSRGGRVCLVPAPLLGSVGPSLPSWCLERVFLLP